MNQMKYIVFIKYQDMYVFKNSKEAEIFLHSRILSDSNLKLGINIEKTEVTNHYLETLKKIFTLKEAA